jgi:long-chain acyl-CoA synthetase
MSTLSLAAVLAEAARRHPERTAVVDGDLRVSYARLWHEARAYAAGLREEGIRPGRTVALLVPNTVDFPRAYFGALAAGAVVVPVHLLLTADEVAYVLRDSGADLLVCHSSVRETGMAAAAGAGVPVVGVGPAPDGAPAPDGGAGPRRLEDLSAAVAPLPTYETRRPDDTAVVFYTSGTTGEPKGALLTHLTLVMNATVNVFDATPSGRRWR